MSSNNTVQFSMDAAQLIAEAKRVNQQLVQTGAQFEQVGQVVQKFTTTTDAAGNKVLKFVGSVVKGVDALGNSLEATFNRMSNLTTLKLGTDAEAEARQAEKAYDSFANAAIKSYSRIMKERRKAAEEAQLQTNKYRASNVSTHIDSTLQNNIGISSGNFQAGVRLTGQALNDVANKINGIQSSLAKLDPDRIKAIVASLRVGTLDKFNTLDATEATVVKQILSLQKFYQKQVSDHKKSQEEILSQEKKTNEALAAEQAKLTTNYVKKKAEEDAAAKKVADAKLVLEKKANEQLAAEQAKLTTNYVKMKEKEVAEEKKANEAIDADNARLSNNLRKRREKEAEEAAAVSRKQVGVNSVGGFQGQLGGFQNNFTQQGIINIQRASLELQKLYTNTSITQQRFDQLFNAVRDGSIRGFGQLSTDELKAELGMRKLINAFNTASTAGQRTVDIMVNFNTASRIIAIQQGHLVISKFTQAILQSVEAGKEYEIRLAEIQTITQAANRSTQQWSGSLVALSNNFGTDLLKTTEAAYEAVSNQIAKGANVTVFLAEALKLARTSVATADEAVNILSSSINAYGTSANSAARYSAVLFKLADLGRVRVGQLANTFGNSATLANQLGIDIESLSASLAVLTIQGVRPDTSMTLINNIMLKLIKPTKEMTGLFNKWGVASGEAAIATFGFQGVLGRLDEELKTGGIARLAEVGNDMRAIRGLAALTGKSFEEFTKALQQMRGAQVEFDEAAKLTADTIAHKLNVEFTKLNNLFVADAAQRYNKILLEFAQNTGGLAENLKPFVDTGLNLIQIASDLATALIYLSKKINLTGDNISNIVPALLAAYGTYKTLTVVIPLLTTAYTFLSTSLASSATAIALASAFNAPLIVTTNTLTASLWGLVTVEAAATLGLSLLAAGAAYYISTTVQYANELANAGTNLENRLNEQSQEYLIKLSQRADAATQVLVGSLSKNEQAFNKYAAAIQSILNQDLKEKIEELLNPLEGLSNNRNFELNLIGASEEEKLSLVTERIKTLQEEIKLLDQSGDLEGVQDKFKELASTAKGFTDEAVRGLDKINKELAKFDKDSLNKKLEHQLAGLTDTDKIEKYRELIGRLMFAADHQIVFHGDVQGAKDRLDEAEKFASKLIELTGKNSLNPKKGGKVQGIDLEEEIQVAKRALLLKQQKNAQDLVNVGKSREIDLSKNAIDGVKLQTADMKLLKEATIEAANAVKTLKEQLEQINKERSSQIADEDSRKNAIVGQVKSLTANTSVVGNFQQFNENGTATVNSVGKINAAKDDLNRAINQYDKSHAIDINSAETQENYENVIKLKNTYLDLINAANKYREGVVKGPIKTVAKDINDKEIGLANVEKDSDKTVAILKNTEVELGRFIQIQDSQIARIKKLTEDIPDALKQFNKVFEPAVDKLDGVAEKLKKSGKAVIDALENQAKERGLIPQDRRGAFIPPSFTPQVGGQNNVKANGLASNSIVNVGDINITLSGNNTQQNARELAKEIRRGVRNGTIQLT